MFGSDGRWCLCLREGGLPDDRASPASFGLYLDYTSPMNSRWRLTLIREDARPRQRRMCSSGFAMKNL